MEKEKEAQIFSNGVKVTFVLIKLAISCSFLILIVWPLTIIALLGLINKSGGGGGWVNWA